MDKEIKVDKNTLRWMLREVGTRGRVSKLIDEIYNSSRNKERDRWIFMEYLHSHYPEAYRGKKSKKLTYCKFDYKDGEEIRDVFELSLSRVKQIIQRGIQLTKQIKLIDQRDGT